MKVAKSISMGESVWEDVEKRRKKENRNLSNFVETAVIWYCTQTNEEPFHAPQQDNQKWRKRFDEIRDEVEQLR